MTIQRRRSNQNHGRWPQHIRLQVALVHSLIFLALLGTECANSFLAPRPSIQRYPRSHRRIAFGRSCDTGRSGSTIRYAHRNIDDDIIISPPSLLPITSALLKISFDGRRFTGWSAANDPKPGDPNFAAISKKSKKRDRLGRGLPPLKGHVRSVKGVLRGHLAQIYGNIDLERIIVEGCSRTDKGVHAKSMMAMIYGLEISDNLENVSDVDSAIFGKRTPHPRNSTDASSFLPVPMELPKLAFALNRMLPPDIRIVGIAPTPSSVRELANSTSLAVFHPSLSTVTKTYVYAFSIGSNKDTSLSIVDPTARRWVWHIPTATAQPPLDIHKMEEACRILQGTHDFSAFQGAPRGETDRLKRQQAPPDYGVCTLKSIVVKEVPKDDFVPSMPTPPQYMVEVVGDRFLYKMIRFLVGALVDIGLNNTKNGSMDLERFKLDLKEPGQHDSARSFCCAPAHGLILHEVDYGVEINWQPLRN